MYHYSRMKEIVCDLIECAEETGYDYDFLAENVEDLVESGDTYDEAMDQVLTVAYEYDF